MQNAEPGRTKCEHLLSEARVKARDVVDEARVRADTMLHDARITAETLERRSWEGVALLEQDATLRHTEALDALSQEKCLLERNIDELRAFTQENHTRITAYVQSQLQMLAKPHSDTPIAPCVPSSLLSSSLDAR
jgi:hypothetical protein